MSKPLEFQSICADYSDTNNYIFDLDARHNGSYDCVETYVIPRHITLYGIPPGLSDNQMERLFQRDYRDAVRIGELYGCLILCRQMIEEGHDPLVFCDAEDGDLGYAISALQDADGPLNIGTGDPEQDVFHVHYLDMESGYGDLSLKGRILDELPSLILALLHNAPHIVSFFPAPLEYLTDVADEERYNVLQNIVAQKIDSILSTTHEAEPTDNIFNFADAYKFSDDDVDVLIQRGDSGSPYPEDAKDLNEWALYQGNGFKEAGNSKLLYKVTRRS